jgi:hypothetical protein
VLRAFSPGEAGTSGPCGCEAEAVPFRGLPSLFPREAGSCCLRHWLWLKWHPETFRLLSAMVVKWNGVSRRRCCGGWGGDIGVVRVMNTRTTYTPSWMNPLRLTAISAGKYSASWRGSASVLLPRYVRLDLPTTLLHSGKWCCFVSFYFSDSSSDMCCCRCFSPCILLRSPFKVIAYQLFEHVARLCSLHWV